MNVRKAYARPAILTEDVLEQTSLACNSTAPFVGGDNSGNFAPGTDDDGSCQINVAKGNSFAEEEFCATVLRSPSDVVVLS